MSEEAFCDIYCGGQKDGGSLRPCCSACRQPHANDSMPCLNGTPRKRNWSQNERQRTPYIKNGPDRLVSAIPTLYGKLVRFRIIITGRPIRHSSIQHLTTDIPNYILV